MLPSPVSYQGFRSHILRSSSRQYLLVMLLSPIESTYLHLLSLCRLSKPWGPVLKVKAAKRGSRDGSGSEGSASKRQRLADSTQAKLPVGTGERAAEGAQLTLKGSTSPKAATAAAAALPPSGAAHSKEEMGGSSSSGSGRGLGGLLGDYGSDSEGEGLSKEARQDAVGTDIAAVAAAGASESLEAHPQQNSGKMALPSAQDVLEGEMPDTLSRPKAAEDEGHAVHSMLGAHEQQVLTQARIPCYEKGQNCQDSADDEIRPRGGGRQRGWV